MEHKENELQAGNPAKNNKLYEILSVFGYDRNYGRMHITRLFKP
jgi:hypothetical protein